MVCIFVILNVLSSVLCYCLTMAHSSVMPMDHVVLAEILSLVAQQRVAYSGKWVTVATANSRRVEGSQGSRCIHGSYSLVLPLVV